MASQKVLHPAMALVVALVMFSLYRATLLPGVELGDSGSFQTMAGAADIMPRDGYPLYFAIGSLFVHRAGSPAAGLNLASAFEGAVACGLLTLVGAELSGSILAGMAAGLLFGASYTFWSQSVIAEVYALHIALVTLSLLMLFRWERNPTPSRLALFFAAYALGFGNHLLMILLAPGFIVFLLLTARGGWRSMCAPRVIGTALLCALAGALVYTWNLHGLWLGPQPPHDVVDGLRTFWFDVTKSDWRDTMVLEVPASAAVERLRLYRFDVQQQFGWPAVVVGVFGIVALARTSPRRAVLLGLAYVVNLAFAFGYNVGDSHVFFLPSHLALALLMAPGLTWIGRITRGRHVVAPAAMVLAVSRMYSDYPALDRSVDGRPQQVVQAVTSNLAGHDAVLVSDLNWQIENGLTYYTERERPDLVVVPLAPVMLYAPALIRDNAEIGREVLVSESARARLASAYGPWLHALPYPTGDQLTLTQMVRGLEPGTRYVIAILQPTRDESINEAELQDTLEALGAVDPFGSSREAYAVVAGAAGNRPALVRSSAKPFRVDTSVNDVSLTVRMESWLAFDTIRRMGFGHAIANRRHTLIVERGVSFAAFGPDGDPLITTYRSNIFAPQPRYLIRR